MKKLFSKYFAQLLLVALVIAFYLPNILLGKFPIPADALLGLYHPWRDNSYSGYSQERFPAKNPLTTDPILQTYPWRLQVIENINEGNLPLWNPFTFSGEPLLANIQSATFSVFNLLFFIFNFKVAWVVQIIVISVLAAQFMYLFLRNQRFSTSASIFGSLALTFSSFFIIWEQWGTVTATAIWLPLILLSIEKLVKNKTLIWFIVLIFATSQVIFAGHPQTALYVFMATFIFLITKLKTQINKLKLVLLALFLGTLITMVQVLPTLELVTNSARQEDQSYSEGREDWFIPKKHLIQIIAPDFFGNPTTANYWGVWNYAEFVTYTGIITLSLVLVSMFLRKKNYYFLSLLVISLILAIENPISKIPYILNLPFLSSLQPSRIIFLLVFSMSALAAYAFGSLLDKFKKIYIVAPLIITFVILALFLFTIFAKGQFSTINGIETQRVAQRNLLVPLLAAISTVALFAIRVKISKKAFSALAALLLTAELFRFGWKFLPFSKVEWIYPDTSTTSYLQQQPKPFRVMTTDRRVLNTNTPSVYDIETINGYNPLFLKSYSQLISSLSSNKFEQSASFNRIIHPDSLNSKLLGLLNVKYVVSQDVIDNENLKSVHQEGTTKIYENTNFLPRAFFVSEVKLLSNDKDEVNNLLADDFDLSNQATSQTESFTQEKNGTLSFQNYERQNFSLITTNPNNGFLVTTNIFYPGWKAFIDAKQEEIKKVNFTFMGLYVPAGNHEITFKYSPKSFYNGLYISLAGLVLTAAASILVWKKKFL